MMPVMDGVTGYLSFNSAHQIIDSKNHQIAANINPDTADYNIKNNDIGLTR